MDMQKSVETITTQQLEAEGKEAYQRGDLPTAVTSFTAAQEGYKLQGDTIMAAEMANNLCVALLKIDDPQAAFEAVEGTVAVFSAAKDQRRQAMALGNRASALEALGKLEEAIADYQESSRLLKEIGEDDLHMDVVKSISALQLKSGRSLEALATMQTGISGIEKPNFTQRLLKRLLSLPGRLFGR